MSKAHCYVRVSHTKSAQSGLSVEGQKEALMKYVDAMGLKLADTGWPHDETPGFYIDRAQSAWKKKFIQRPAGRILRENCRPGDHIVVYSIDRGFRSVLDFSNTVKTWYDSGVYVHLTSQRFSLATANGMLMANILASFAQWKSDVISERTREALAERKLSTGKTRKPKVKFEPSGLLSEYNKLTKEDRESLPCMGTIYTYSRASHLDSVDSNLGLEAQRKKTRSFAEFLCGELKCDIGNHFCDKAVSGYKVPFSERPEAGNLDRMLRPGDHIVVSRLDRAWRSTKDMLNCIDRWKAINVSVHFCDLGVSSDTPLGKVFLNMMCTLAEWESDFISERTKMALDIARQEGRPTGQVSYGFKVSKCNGKKMVSLEEDRIRGAWHVWHMKENHGMSFTQISDHMERIDAYRENREPIPRSGKFNRRLGEGCRSSKFKGLQIRYWNVDKCKKAIINWPNLHKLIKEAKARGDEI